MTNMLGFDIGTTSIKMKIIHQGETLYGSSRNITTYARSNGVRYQRSAEVIYLVTELIREIPIKLRESTELISFSVAMHSLMPMTNGVCDEIFLWSDNQAELHLNEFRQTSLADSFYFRTGTPVHAMTPFAKLLHFKIEDSYPDDTKWYGMKELLLAYFTGRVMVDISTASATGLFNIETMQWDEEILNYLEISEKQLASIVLPTDRFYLKSDIATEFGFSIKTQVAPGATDGCLAAYAGWKANGCQNSLTIGTSAAIRVIGNKKVLNIDQMNFCYLLMPDCYVSGAPSNNGGIVLQWAAETLAQDKVAFYNEVTEAIKKSEIGAKGVRFFPFLNGGRAPYWTSDITGHFDGFTINTTRAELLRSILEGILFNLRTLAENLKVDDLLTLSGGFFFDDAVVQMTVDLIGIDGVLSQQNEPIFGLYYLLLEDEQPVASNNLSRIRVNKKAHDAYTNIFLGYFEI